MQYDKLYASLCLIEKLTEEELMQDMNSNSDYYSTLLIEIFKNKKIICEYCGFMSPDNDDFVYFNEKGSKYHLCNDCCNYMFL